jgi:hypothetical protein
LNNSKLSANQDEYDEMFLHRESTTPISLYETNAGKTDRLDYYYFLGTDTSTTNFLYMDLMKQETHNFVSAHKHPLQANMKVLYNL